MTNHHTELSVEAKRQLLAKLLQTKNKSFPLSFAQQRMWVLWQLDPDNPGYNVAAAVRFAEALDPTLVEQTLNAIIKRHETLRTTFDIIADVPAQMIAPTLTLSVPVISLHHVSAAEQDIEIQRLANEEAQRPFDLQHGPLLRTAYVDLGTTGCVIILNMHHIIADGWSINIFIREFAALYGAFARGEAPVLPELPIQYVDYAVWQRKHQKDTFEQHYSYWQQQLADMPGQLALLTDRPRPATQSLKGATKYVTMPASLFQAIKALSSQTGVTPFMTLLAGFKLLLYRYTNQADVVVGTPIANRTRAELAHLIGFFVNTLVLRTSLTDDLTFHELLQRVREVTWDAYAHADMPFEELVSRLQPERMLSHTPLFQVMFAFIDNTDATPPSETFQLIELDNGTTKYDVTLSLTANDQELTGFIQYSTDLFNPDTIDRLMHHFQTLLQEVTAQPHRHLLDYPLMTETEQQQVLMAREVQPIEVPVAPCLHHWFEMQVNRTPDAVAVVFEGQQCTYQALNDRANQLAHYLQARGVGPDVLVGLCVERSLEMIMGIVGILKAGGAYVPLDSTYPQERLAFMLADTQAPVLVTQAHLVNQLPPHTAETICLDTDWPAIAQTPTEHPTSLVGPENLVYVIYTSGSTGQPKGVQIQHNQVTRLFTTTYPWFHFNQHDVWTLFHSYAFDFSVWELWGALLYGGRLVVVPYMTSRSPERLYELLHQEQVTVLNQTPSAFRQLIWTETEATLRQTLALRLVIFGGEALELQSLRPWFNQYGDTRPQLVNMYGITETTVHVTYRPISLADLDQDAASVIGGPMSDLDLYILDRSLRPVPIGLAGELHVGGAGLARGYRNNPDLTAARFVPHPFSTVPGARLYGTGDRARLLANGDIEYLGRIDQQVKIRGFRIELGEIETVLAQHPAVRETVVVVNETSVGSKHLVAYVVPQPAAQLQSSDLYHFVRTALPDYMVPSDFMILEALPLTANGKINRRALPDINATRLSTTTPLVAPRTFHETQLADIWSQVLGRPQLSIHDNFFEVGGDSILAIQIVARANQVGLQLTPKLLFQHPTIADLAAVARTTPTIEAEQGIVTGSVPLTPVQHWFFEQDRADAHHWNQAVVFELRQPIKPALLSQAVSALLVQHDALRLRFTHTDRGWNQIHASLDDPIPCTQVDVSALSETAQNREIERITTNLQSSLNIADGPLLHVVLFECGPDRVGSLLIIIHHLVVDGVSWRPLLEDLQTTYQQLERGEALHLPPKTTSLQVWAERLTEYAQSPALLEEAAYWLPESSPAISRLPLDHLPESGTDIQASAKTMTISLSAAETSALLQDVPKVYSTHINDALLAALGQTLARWIVTPKLLIDLEGHGREDLFDDVDLSRTVGWFTTIFPVYLYIDTTNEPGEWLKTTKEQLRRIPHGGIGYGLLRYLSTDQTIVNRLQTRPQAEVLFNYLGQLDYGTDESALFGRPHKAAGPAQSPSVQRRHLLVINSYVVNGQLHLDWEYSQHRHKHTTIEHLSHNFVEALRALITHCQSPEAGGFTPSDFPLADLDDETLNVVSTLLTQVEQGVPR